MTSTLVLMVNGGWSVCSTTFGGLLDYCAFSFFINFRARKKDKLRYRYPRGESYLDVIQRFVTCSLTDDGFANAKHFTAQPV